MRWAVTEPLPICKAGLHLMTPDNIYVQPNSPGRRCRACKEERLIRWRAENADSVRAWRRGYHAANRERDLARNRALRQQNKLDALQRYGGACACCGETETAFLAIDHVNGGGNKQRRQIGAGTGSGGDVMYRWLRRNGYPQGDYQVLCFNCNHGRFVNGGHCPHEGKR